MVLAVKIYFATVDSLLAAEAALGVILRDSTDPVQQSTCAAEILGVRRELELLKNKRRVLMDGTATITPPTAGMVTTAQENAARLAHVIATTAQFAAIVGLVKDSLTLFERLGV
jgi:hypothetical protein